MILHIPAGEETAVASALRANAGLLSDGEWAVAVSLARRYPRQVGECP